MQTAVASWSPVAGARPWRRWLVALVALAVAFFAGSGLMTGLPLRATAPGPNAIGPQSSRFDPRQRGEVIALGAAGVTARFGPGGLAIAAAGGRLSMKLVAVGRGRRLRALAPVAPRIRSGRVVYAPGDGVLEWYQGGRTGVEQGFVLARRPPGRGGVLTWELQLAGLRARLLRAGVEFLARSGAAALRYRGLAAVDASGRPLAAWLAVSDSRLELRVADRGAQYPVRIDPVIEQAPRATTSSGFTVSHVLVHARDGSITLWAKVPGRGTIDVLETAWNDNFAAAASVLAPAARRFVFARLHASASASSTLHLRITPNQRGERLLRVHRYAVTTRLWVTFTPAGGKARSVGFYGLQLTRPAASRRPAKTVAPFVMRALGDSVTAGFGFFADGQPMSALQLPFCVPADTDPNDRCSSNSPNGAGQTGPVGWSPDYGLANDISWAAQAAHSFGLSGANEFQNLAVSGSTPADWAAGGYLHPILDQIVGDDPDLTVMTLGANPLLSIFLTGSGAWCAFTLTNAELQACVERYIVAQRVGPLLKAVVNDLLAAPLNHVVVSLYHLAVPSLTLFTTRDVEILFSAFDAAISSAMRALPSYGSRVFVISPATFFTGIGPGSYICPSNRAAVDGPSHQSDDTQDELSIDPFVSFCAGTPWIISSDTGIHPNRDGYAQFASALVALVRRQSWAPADARLAPGRG